MIQVIKIWIYKLGKLMKKFKDFLKEAEDINKQNVDKAIQHD